MAVTSCEADVLVNADDSSDLVDKKDEKQQMNASYFCKLACVLCGAMPASVTQPLKVLPCLHLTCQHCLIQFLLDTSPPYKDADFAASVFSCPRCSYSIQLPRDGVDGLKDASFLQTANTAAVASDAAQSNDGEWLSDDTGSRHTSMLSSTDVIDCAAAVDELPSSLLRTNCSDAVNHLPKHSGCSNHTIDVTSSVNSEKWHHCDQGLNMLGETVAHTKSQICNLSADVEHCQHNCQQASRCTELAACDLDARRLSLRSSICSRAEHLCELIGSRRDQLLSELDRQHSHSSLQYCERMSVLNAYSTRLEDSSRFASAVLAAGQLSTELDADVAARLNELLLCDPEQAECCGDIAEVTAMRLDVPDAPHEELYVEKLFGSLVKGTVATVDHIRSFNTDLQWPTSFVVMRSHDSVLAGKAGAFADKGQVLFYDSHGSCVHCHILPVGHLPIDVVTVGSGDVLVSDVSGRVTKFLSSGRLVAEWSDMFQGPSGHMALTSGGEVLVTSAGERCLHRYCVTDGRHLATFSLEWPDTNLNAAPDITAITVNSHGEIIVTASNLRSPAFFTGDGQFLHSCSAQPAAGRNVTPPHIDNGLQSALVALPSAICCDAFDNLLVADFLGNCVHLVSHSGLHLGRLLTNKHGIACPNFVSLDQDGRLYVGQYGGDVLVFRYLSYIKHV